ncbi:olfactory receptor 1G1-like [Pseudophryne corroboree]|uniref:olfactory receptor 1G1-like n=1 Tax=Pseudophryne corroboree TaxID=495146 RepID=UPI0030814A69
MTSEQLKSGQRLGVTGAKSLAIKGGIVHIGQEQEHYPLGPGSFTFRSLVHLGMWAKLRKQDFLSFGLISGLSTSQHKCFDKYPLQGEQQTLQRKLTISHVWLEMGNDSSVTEFILLGFPALLSVQIALFYTFFVFYISTLTGNVLIILVTSASTELHTPMYFFLCNLSFLEIFYTSVTIPNMLLNFIKKNNSISFSGCLAQMYFFIALGSIECTLLAVMAYDRYIAICNPLHYVTLMDLSRCIMLVCSSWISGFINSIFHTIFILRLNFCSSNSVNQFFCEIPPLLKLACGSTWLNEIVLLIVGSVYGLGSFLLTFISYIHIISTILKIRSKEGQRKAFSTCASHLIVVTLFFLTCSLAYYKPPSKNLLEEEKFVPVVYAVITPTLNPMIYTLRNKEFKSALRKMISLA